MTALNHAVLCTTSAITQSPGQHRMAPLHRRTASCNRLASVLWYYTEHRRILLSIRIQPWATTCVLRCLVAALLLRRLLWRYMVAPVPAVVPPRILLPIVCSRTTPHVTIPVHAPITC